MPRVLPGEVSSLPKWAQQRFASLERALSDTEKRVALLEKLLKREASPTPIHYTVVGAKD